MLNCHLYYLTADLPLHLNTSSASYADYTVILSTDQDPIQISSKNNRYPALCFELYYTIATSAAVHPCMSIHARQHAWIDFGIHPMPNFQFRS